MFWVYIIKNQNDDLYFGYTNNLERRLNEHNKSNFRWKIVGCEGYLSELDARERERKLKHYGQARSHLKNRMKRSLKL